MGIWSYTCIVHCLVFIVGLITAELSFGFSTRDVFDLLEFINKTDSGFTYVSGTEPHLKAIHLQGSTRNLALPDVAVDKAKRLLQDNDDVTFLATIRQDSENSGSIFSFSSGLYRLLELESRGTRNELLLYYIHDQKIRAETFLFKLDDNRWHQLALTINRTHMTLYIDCNKRDERRILSRDRQFLTDSYFSLFVGQRNTQTDFFKGAIQEIKLVSGPNGHLIQCPIESRSCPDCTQFQNLERETRDMYSRYQSFSIKRLHDDERKSAIHQCQCMKTCHQNVTGSREDELWFMDQCNVCLCEKGDVECRTIDCDSVTCSRPYIKEKCCAECRRNCYYNNIHYRHGESISPAPCITCTCHNSLSKCMRQDPTTCPRLMCSKVDIIHVQGKCCPICRGTDFCAMGHDCHDNATCVNLETRYACQCKRGFQGNGTACEDINECLHAGGKNGHHCRSDQNCVNTIGSYECACRPGDVQKDGQSCDTMLGRNHAFIYGASVTVTWTMSVIATWRCLIIHR